MTEPLHIDGLDKLGDWEAFCRDPENIGRREPGYKFAFYRKLQLIKLVAMSFGGVLTPPFVSLDEEGRKSFTFSQRDLLGVDLLKKYGMVVVVISNRRTKVVEKRCHKMNIPYYSACNAEEDDKKRILQKVIYEGGLFESQAMYIGDEINDLEVMRVGSVAVAVRDARPQVRAIADYVTTAEGGKHAVREVAELLLAANNHELKL